MRKDYEKLFAKLEPLEPPAGLFVKIMDRIQGERRLLTIKRRLVIFSITLAGSLIALIPAFKLMRIGFIESGFTQFFSLFFSDFATMLNYWQSYALTLLESLPIVSLAAFLAVILAFLLSLKFLVHDLQAFLKPKRLLIN